jgi:hypothetical protein
LVWLTLNASSTRPSQLINPDNYASIAGALADEEVGNAIAGDWVKVNDVFYTIITTSPTVAVWLTCDTFPSRRTNFNKITISPWV